MKKWFVLLAAFLPGLLSASPRTVLDFNAGWEFSPDGWAGASRRVDLPHDFQLEMPWREEAGGDRGFKPMGAARYRNAFVTDAAWKGARVFLDFEGLMCVGDVWVNGEKVAATEYGYLGFEVDVTKRLNPAGGTNRVEVWASTGQRYGSRWYTGGGLYRPVRIKTRPARSIARHGLFVSTPRASETAATVRVQVEGAATLLALDNGDHFTDESFAVREKAMKEGFLLAILRAGRVGGEVSFRVEGESLPPASLKLLARN